MRGDQNRSNYENEYDYDYDYDYEEEYDPIVPEEAEAQENFFQEEEAPRPRRRRRRSLSDSDLAQTAAPPQERRFERKRDRGDRAPARPVKKPAARQGTKTASGMLSSLPFWQIQLGLLAVIVLIAVVAVVRLRSWNRGSTIELNPEIQGRFDVEVNDSMIYLPESKLEGHEDDGVTTILCLGGDPFADDRTQTGLAGQIAELSGATVYNASFPGSRVTCRNWPYATDTIEDMDDIFNLFYVAYAIATDNYEVQDTVATLHADDGRFSESLEVLKNLDMNTVDIIAVMYDGIDYTSGAPVFNEGNVEDLLSYVGCLLSAFDQIQQRYPFIRIVFLSPTYMLHTGEDGTQSDGRTHNLGNGTLVQYWQFGFDACGRKSVSFLDNYYGSVNDANYETYLTDGTHLNEAGCTKIADHFVYKVIQGNYGEYDASSLMVAP